MGAAGEGDVCCCYGTEVVTYEGVDFVVAEGVNEGDGVFDQREGSESVAWYRFESTLR